MVVHCGFFLDSMLPVGPTGRDSSNLCDVGQSFFISFNCFMCSNITVFIIQYQYIQYHTTSEVTIVVVWLPRTSWDDLSSARSVHGRQSSQLQLVHVCS